MAKFHGTIRVKVTTHELPESMRVSYATSLQAKPTPGGTVVFLNSTAKRRGINATYELATEADYWAYRAAIKVQIAVAQS